MNADYESMPPQPMALCYHCDQEKAVPGSVFCGTCQPDRTGQPPRIIHEKRPAMRRKGLFSAFFGLLASSKRVGKVEASLRDCEQANLALRRKCADLKDQLRASEAAFESLYKENALAKAAHNRAASERDALRQWKEETEAALFTVNATSAKKLAERHVEILRRLNKQDLPAGFASWEEYHKYIASLVEKKERLEEIIHHFWIYSAYKGGAPEKLTAKQAALMEEAVNASQIRSGGE